MPTPEDALLTCRDLYCTELPTDRGSSSHFSSAKTCHPLRLGLVLEEDWFPSRTVSPNTLWSLFEDQRGAASSADVHGFASTGTRILPHGTKGEDSKDRFVFVFGFAERFFCFLTSFLNFYVVLNVTWLQMCVGMQTDATAFFIFDFTMTSSAAIQYISL